MTSSGERDRAKTLLHPFRPALLTPFTEGYSRKDGLADLTAGLTVAIVALPLSMAIAIASGLTPSQGLVTAIVGGFLVSAFGGSRFQIGGPAGAFIVLVAAIVERHGVEGLHVAMVMAGAIMMAAGMCRLGTWIRRVPHPVVVGFTAAIAVIIAATQIRDALGLVLPGREPAELVPKLAALWQALPSVNPWSAAIAAATAGIILVLRRVDGRIPGLLLAIVLASVATGLLALPVETIGSRFGNLPSGLPMPTLPLLTPDRLLALLPDALAIAVLGSVESLLSAVVADSLGEDRHRPNTELVAQGIANVGVALFGGLCVTGTIARTATNIRSGARSPIAGMIHAAVLLALLIVAAPLAAFIPLASLAGVLLVVSWTMAERHEVGRILAGRGRAAAVLGVTFVLTAVVGLLEGIAAGIVLALLMRVRH